MIISLATCCFSQLSTASELEITSYKKSSDGVMHYVTVAFKEITKVGSVRCIISKDNKPVGMDKRGGVEGVGTVTVFILGGVVGNTTASCQETTRSVGN